MSVEELKRELEQLSDMERASLAGFLAELRSPLPSSLCASFLETARGLKLDGPADWSERFEDYLYGNGHDATR